MSRIFGCACCSSAPRTASPVCGLLPPHILEHLAKDPTISSTRRDQLLRNLSINSSFNIVRIGFSESTRATTLAARFQRLAPGGRLLTQTGVPGQPNRTIYTANNSQKVPGQVVLTEAQAQTQSQTSSADPALNEAFNFLGSVYKFYWDVFNRNSIDDNGLPLHGTIHFDQAYDNAYWDGQRMIFGDGDDVEFNRFTISVDVIGHELTHGVTQHTAGLVYFGQSGALNESISDVFGSLVKQYANNQSVDQADWLMGKGLFTNTIQQKYSADVAIRSLKAPGTAYNDPTLGQDPQPAHYSNYVHTLQDNGGVHINSGIPNHAFYLAAQSLAANHPPGTYYAWTNLGLVWYQTLLSPALLKPQLHNAPTFQDFANLTVETASTIFPQGPEAQAISNAWSAVGIDAPLPKFKIGSSALPGLRWG